MPGREKSRRVTKRTNPLGEDLHADRFASAKRKCTTDDMEGDVECGVLLPSRTTQKILKTAREQLQTIANEEEEYEEVHGVRHEGRISRANNNNNNDDSDDAAEEDPGVVELERAGQSSKMAEDTDYHYYYGGGNNTHSHTSSNHGHVEDNEEEVVIEYDDVESVVSEMPSNFNMEEGMYGIDDEEARLLQKFQPPSRAQGRSLADMIMEKIREREGVSAAANGTQENGVGTESREEQIDPRVARVYTAIGSILKHYTSGKVPKAFKVLPNIKNWEQLLMLTKPHEWSPHATYQATRIFAANLNERMAQRFYAAVLLPMVHQYMSTERKLHPALYMAIRKALFKPVAFFKGFVLPLAADDECTLREALIVASVLQRMHLPPVPTAVTIVKLAQQPFSGTRSVFLRVMIDKKMAMPYQAIDALVEYFHRFVRTHNNDEKLPVLWHQTLLSFTQRYKRDLTVGQLGMLQQVCTKHFHYLITPEIRREINTVTNTVGVQK